MKHKYLLIVPAVLALFFYSCDSSVPYNPETDPSWGNFWAIDVSTYPNRPYRVDAEILASGDLCEIWVDKKSGIGVATAKAMVKAYEGVEGEAGIYQKMMETFDIGRTVTIGGNEATDTMEAADLLGDENKKLCILLLDIRDGYRSENDPYVAGYFWSEDILPRGNNLYSNGRDMIYVDILPCTPGSDESNSTVAHEMQHLMNFVTTEILKKEPGSRQTAMELWIDEGLAGAAEWVYSGKHSEQRWKWFSLDPLTTISQGNNFYVWDNHENVDPSIVLDDYATVYFFFQWLRLRFPDVPNIYNKIITSQYSDYKAITSNTNGYVNNLTSDWAALMEEWLIANYVKATEGPYGYGKEEEDKQLNDPWVYIGGNFTLNVDVNAKTIPKGIQDDFKNKNKLEQYPLYPGEAVYSRIDTGNTAPSQSGNIRYATITRDNPNNPIVDFDAGNILLSFNSNTANDGQNMITAPDVDFDNSTITGYENPEDWEDWPILPTGTSRSMAGGRTFPGPFAVSARDMSRINKYKENNSSGEPAFVPRRLADE